MDPFEQFAQRMQQAGERLEAAKDAVPKVIGPVVTVDELVSAYEAAEELAEAAAAQKTALNAIIGQMTLGEEQTELLGSKKKIVVDRRPGEGWDQDELARIFKSSPPPWARVKFDIPDATLKKLSSTELATIASARKPTKSRLKIKIEEL